MGILGSLLFLGGAVDKNMLTALREPTESQVKVTKATHEAAKKIMNYCATHPNPTTRFQGTQMSLKVHGDA